MKCVICGKSISGFGNDPWPIKMEGECCKECNMDVVLPARILMLKKHFKRNGDNNHGTASEEDVSV